MTGVRDVEAARAARAAGKLDWMPEEEYAGFLAAVRRTEELCNAFEADVVAARLSLS